MTCGAEKEYFENLSSKNKTELYEQFVQDMFRKDPQFKDHNLLMEISVKMEQARCEVVEDKEPEDHEELETSFVYFDESISSMDLLCTTNSVDGYEDKLCRPTRSQVLEDFSEETETSYFFFDETYSSMDLICTSNSAEAYGIKEERQTRNEVINDLPEEREKSFIFFGEAYLYIMDLLGTTDSVEAYELEEERIDISLLGQYEEDEFLIEEAIIETLNKRCSNEMYSSLQIEAYAPPHKRKCTRDAKLYSHLCFPNQQLEKLFFIWLREKQQEIRTDNHHSEAVIKTSSAATAKKCDLPITSLPEIDREAATSKAFAIETLYFQKQTESIVNLAEITIESPNKTNDKINPKHTLSISPKVGNDNNNPIWQPVNEIQTLQSIVDFTNKPATNPSRSLNEREKSNDNQRYPLQIPVTGEVQQVQQHLSDSPECPNCTVRTNISNAIDTSQLANDVSQFWIKSGDLFISMEIDHINGEKLQQIYQKFCKKSAETREVHFGIDEFQFMISYRYDSFINFEHLPDDKETSQYWISSGDLEIPFQGKHMSTEKILRLFGFFKSNVEDTSVLRFGIDKLDFSQIPDFWSGPDCSDLENTSNYNGCESSNNFVLPDSLPLNDEYENLKETEASQCDPMENNFQSSSVFYDNNRRALVKNDCDNYRFDESENNCELPCELCDNNQNGLVINECENHYCQSRENDCQLPCTSASNNQGGLIRNDCDLSCPSCGGSVCELCLPTSQAGPMHQLRVCEENCNHNQQMNVDNQNYESNEQIAFIYSNCETNQQTEAIEQNNNSNSEALTSPEPSTGYFYRQNILLSLELEAANHNNESNEQAEGINLDYDTDQEAEAYNEYSNDDSDGQVLVTDANEEIRDHDYEEPMQIASNSSSSADISCDIALDSAQNIQEFLNCIVTDINTLSDDSSVEQLQTFMCLLQQGANVCFGHMDKIYNALINKMDAEPVDNYG